MQAGTAIYDGETSLLEFGQRKAFYILNCDHRGAYKKLTTEGLGSCMKYFIDDTSLVHGKSDTLDCPMMI